MALSGKPLEGVSQKLGLLFQRGLNEALYTAVKSWQQCISLTVWEWLSNYRASRRWDMLCNLKMAPPRLFNDVETWAGFHDVKWESLIQNQMHRTIKVRICEHIQRTGQECKLAKGIVLGGKITAHFAAVLCYSFFAAFIVF